MIAFVRSLTSERTDSASMLSVSSRMSANTGVAPVCTITFAVAGHVSEDVITSSPGPTPSATSDRCRAAVPEETASTCFASRYSRMRASSSAVRGPVVSQPDRRVAATASISASEIAGGWNERNSDRFAETSGICGDEAYAVRGGIRERERLVAGAAGGEERAGAVGAAPKRREDVAGVAIDPNPLDSLEVVRHVDTLEHAGRSDQELGCGTGDPDFVL